MAIVNEILKTKLVKLTCVSPDIMVIDALRLMAEKNIGAVPVTENEKLVGMFSERDYARKIILMDKASGTTSIREVMTTDFYTVKTTTSLADCMRIMTAFSFRHLPVVDDGRLVGLISTGDLVKFMMEEQTIRIKTLESSISK